MAVLCDGMGVLRFDEPRPVTLIVVPLLVLLVQRASFVHQRIGLVLSRDVETVLVAEPRGDVMLCSRHCRVRRRAAIVACWRVDAVRLGGRPGTLSGLVSDFGP